MMTAPAENEEALFRYAANPLGVTGHIHHRYLIPCIRPMHDKPVIIPPDKHGIPLSIGCATER
ncbi:MAG: hypothetical protein WCE46_04675 [Methanoregula sp.]|uniref:hypothetical protein n=1 Tax=Methanoregula sp. TaxID=2052170 RepID=UPI003C78F49D